jgi:putative FmdB family regulatory protein
LPRYDYQCTICDNRFELVQSFKEAGSGTCPVCSGEGRRVFHAVPVIYKGSGFYTTDYGRPKSPPSETKEKESSGTSESSSSDSANGSSPSESKSESTPAAAETSA